MGLLGLAAVGCGGDTYYAQEVVMVDAGQAPPPAPTTYTVTGTVQGAIVDAYDGQPLAGVKLTINFNGAAQTVTTDATGTYSFKDVPATTVESGTAFGKYAITLDASAVSGRKYRAFRSAEIEVRFAAPDSTITADAKGNTKVPVVPTGLTATAKTFRLAQTRSKVSGVVRAEGLAPAQVALQLRRNGACDGSAIPDGAVEAATTSDATGAFSFADVEEGCAYQVVSGDMNWVVVANPALAGAASSPTYNGDDVRAPEGAAAVQDVGIVFVRKVVPSADTVPPFATAVSTANNDVIAKPTAAAPYALTVTFSEAMDASAPLEHLLSFKLTGWMYGDQTIPSWVDQSSQVFYDSATGVRRLTVAWDAAGTKVTFTPIADANSPFASTVLVPGGVYEVKVSTSKLRDKAGNPYAATVQGVNPQPADALSSSSVVSGTTDTIKFMVKDDLAIVVLSNISQEANTADNVAAAMTREEMLELIPSNDPNRTFPLLSQVQAGIYSSQGSPQTKSDRAYVHWTPDANARKYNVYVRRHGDTLAKVLWATNLTLRGIDVSWTDAKWSQAQYANILPAGGAWANNGSFDVGVSATNANNVEGSIVWVEVRDNTGPSVAANRNFNYSAAAANDSLRVTESATPLTASGVGGAATQTPDPTQTMPNKYGIGTYVFQLSEPILASSVTADAVSYVSGALPAVTVGAGVDPNAGEADPSIVAVSVDPSTVVQGRTSSVRVTVSDTHLIDTGDKLVFKKASGITDIAGNAISEPVSGDLTLVDGIAPAIKSVTFAKSASNAGGTATVKLSKYSRLLSGFGASAYPGAASASGIANFATADTITMTIADDVGTWRGYNGVVYSGANWYDDGTAGAVATSPACLMSAAASSFSSNIASLESKKANTASLVLQGVQSVDTSSQTNQAGVYATGSDYAGGGQVSRAYQFYGVTQSAFGATVRETGPFEPDATGIGTEPYFKDVVGPRLSDPAAVVSSNYVAGALQGSANAAWSNSTNSFRATNATYGNASPDTAATTVIKFDVYTTEPTDHSSSAVSALNPANWTVQFSDVTAYAAIGAPVSSYTTSNSSWANAPTPTDATFTIQSVAGDTPTWCNGATRYKYTLTVSVRVNKNRRSNGAGTPIDVPTTGFRYYGISSIKLNGAAADIAGNAVSGFNLWSWNSSSGGAWTRSTSP